jgi:thymidylate synthase (FAD)
MIIELVAHTPNPETLIARAASTCYDSVPKELDSARKMIAAIIKSGHESCIEHATASFSVDGVSRVLTHELVRHRIGFSYSQRSQRYVNEKDPSFVIPEEIRENEEAMKVYSDAMDMAWESYRKLQKLGLKNEMARYVLPNSCCTKIFITADFRAWRNFLKLRLSKRAQHEIRDFANVILEKLHEIAPSCFEDLRKGENVQNT